ncbi:MAG: NAD(P)-dependent oxidoreductase [Neptuniibacter caesariensis]|uniref:NAD(P)-dependent oxidoreductase n=1 Tax=Neptuniibacter caesariensis TaxID=207954 RepID=A0A2G6JAB3_NEPCE|nr:MAG: NAD(P)-dependent oxidoreductase [Neptuniibacter caesariensis]
MQKKTVIIAGCGYIGSTLAQQLLDMGHAVTGLRRNINQLPQGIQGVKADLSQLDDLKTALATISRCDILVYCASANAQTAESYQAAYIDGLNNLLAALPVTPQHTFFTSSTSVYHQNDHSWVDEESPCQPDTFSGKITQQAENRLLSSHLPATVVRFSGIYGPGRNHLINRVKQGAVAPQHPLQYSNRIHRDDCAGVLAHLIQRVCNNEAIDDCYLASDDQPCSLYEITHWLAQQMNVTELTESISRFASSKRCNNSRLKATGYNFIHPGFKSGYAAMLSS